MKAHGYQLGNQSIVAVQDALTHAECAEFRDLVLQAAGTTNGKVVLDFSEMPFVDSAGLELLIELSKECAIRGGRMKLAAPSPNCQEILRLTDLRSRFEVINSVEEATRRGM